MKADRDFSKIVNARGDLIGVLNFNNMIPVNNSVLVRFDIRPKSNDSASEKAYKSLMQDQLRWCNDHRDVIQRKASKLYRIVTEKPDSARGLVRRCCNFPVLEKVLDAWVGQ